MNTKGNNMEAYLYEVNGIEDFERYYQIKADPTAILWSGFSKAPDKEKLKIHFTGLLKDIHSGNKHLVYLLEKGSDSLIGYDLMTEVAPDTIESSGHSILTMWQGKGMGTTLFSLLKQKAKNLGYKFFTGWISDNNIGSIKNVEKNGFVRTEEYRVGHLDAFNRDDVFHKYICEL